MINYTHSSLVQGVTKDEQPKYLRGMDKYGYGSKITSVYKIKYDGYWKRVYITCFSNVASLWITKGGKKLFLDPHTEHKLEQLK